MLSLGSVDVATLRGEAPALTERLAAFKAAGLALDMTRGKPCAEQLELASGLLTNLPADDFRAADGTDCRNYGGLDGLPEAKALLAPLLGVAHDEIIVGGNSSLTLMHQTLSLACSHGVVGGSGAWREQRPKFLCPAPGYDRHFAICEHLGIEMVAVPMTVDGPDMDVVERLVAADHRIKGIWLVPKYSNPTGTTLSSEVVERLARMSSAATDFRIMWDNAYAVHHLGHQHPVLADILGACKAAGHDERPLLYGSTSKISFAGAGLAVMGGSLANMRWMRSHLAMLTIGPDKLNQLRHVRFFRDVAGIEAHMRAHAEILRPKFSIVQKVLEEELRSLAVAQWNDPQGGYFVSLDTVPGCAARVVALAGELGVKFTPAGATYPYGRDPADCNIRIAPSLPTVPEIEQAMRVLCVCVKLATIEALSASAPGARGNE